MDNLVIQNANVILPGGVEQGASVCIENGVISAITPGAVNGSAYRVLDAAGCYLSPGFIDLHTHGRCLCDTMDNSRESLEIIARDLLSHGTTGFLITTQSAPLERTLEVIKTAVAYIKNPAPDGAAPLGIYMEGPYFAAEKKGAQELDNADTVNLDGLRAMLDAGEGYVRVAALAPELPGAIEAIRMITSRGAAASAGHTNSSYDEAMTAIEAGISLSTHTFNAMRPISHREPSVVGACLTDNRVICEAIADGIHLHPAVLKLLYMTKGAEGVALISDSIAAAGIPDGEYDYGGRGFTVGGGVIRLKDGTIAGSMLNLNSAVRNAVKFTGCPLHEAVNMAALTPAGVIGMGKNRGSIEVGKAADLVLFNDGFEIQTVIIGGRPVSQ